jgi:cohesin domain-containing protein
LGIYWSAVRKRTLFGGLVIAVAAAAAAAYWPRQPSPQADAAPAAQRPAEAAGEGARFAALPQREPIGKDRGDIFSSRSWAPVVKPAKPGPVVVAPPSAPPMPYRAAGIVTHGRDAHVVLAKGDAVFIVKEGESLEGGYQVEKIGADQVTLVYTPLGVRESLPLVVTLGADVPQRQMAAPAAPAREGAPQPPADSRPAQMRWEGPLRVREGSDFEVALKVTSAHPVIASPLHLSYDAKLLLPVAVRRGAYFAAGTFSYRVSPQGSILVGATGEGGVAADAEFVVVTFKPIRSGATAELSLSSAVLRGDAGRAIVYDSPGAFRTTIVQ